MKNDLFKYNYGNIASNTLDLLAANSSWVLMRHQWLIDNMRSILTGEDSPPLNRLCEFDQIVPKEAKMDANVMNIYLETKSHLESLWHETTKASHPASGLSVFEQLNQFQQLSHQFMQSTKEVNQRLWQTFTLHDPLTGALTRFGLEADLSQEIARHKRHHEPSTVVVIDHDRFKKINDSWGRVCGDRVLMITAEIIKNNLRINDKLFRYGGDEWLIIMPATTLVMAESSLSRIQLLISEYAFKPNEDDIFYAHISYGLASCAADSTPSSWISDADTQLYAKRLMQTHLQ